MKNIGAKKMELEELKKTIVRDLNAEEYPFIVEVKGNTVIARWKVCEVPQDVDEKKLRLFSVKYKLRKDKTFYGGEMTAHRYDYVPPMSTQTTSVYSVSASDNLPWRKKVDLKDYPNIGFDAQKLYSIIEHYLMGNGFCYRPGVWNHAYIEWNAGYKLRLVGALFIFVGSFLFIGCIETGILFIQLFPLIHVIIGIWLLLIGLGKVEFYDLRRDIAIKVILGIIIGAWLVVFALMFLEYIGFLNL
ncbi:hypothetical protein [Pseudobutyrivibrio xylanivorans]|uniref:Uncharacterized protein n=1 Tax=Pseudobutyrivibrio xylanivorans TaxID=185007 RepID=A0A5P6VPE9_PSEXY|nr:hypothetical protein [Pseudobutyrivibrio xylanivorans]QFJ54282.1 hypothetical protein FXF36_05120 [Pseudobutyrivibrio xylanivorans]